MMVLTVLLSLVVLLALVSYRIGGSELVSPAFLFCVGFVPATACAFVMGLVWGLDLEIGTLATLVGGLALFVLAATAVNRFVRRKGVLNRFEESRGDMQESSLSVKTIPLLIAFGVQLVVFIWVLMKIRSWYPSDSLFMAIGYYKESNTFTTEHLSFGFPLKQLVNFCKASGYLFAYLFAEQMFLRQPKKLTLCGVNLVLSCILGFVIGGRFLGLGYLVCALFCFLMLRLRRGKRGVSWKGVAGVVAIAALFAVLFQFLSFGRSGSIPFLEYVGIYLGGPILNLNSYLSAGDLGGAVPFGRMTFFCWYTYLGYKLGIAEWQYTFDLPFQYIGGYETGNVYTTFYSFLSDFGYLGLVILVVLMAAISQLVYERAKLRIGKRDDLWVLMSAFISCQLLFSFFSDKFYEEFLTPGFITMAIYLIVVRFLLCRFKPRICRGRTAKAGTAAAGDGGQGGGHGPAKGMEESN